MTHKRRPISFIATQNPDKAMAYYRDILGLTLTEQSPYALVFADGENMLRVQIVTGFAPESHTVHGWQVTNIEQEIGELASRGVAFLQFEQLPQDTSGAWTSPDGSKIAWFKDPDGNILSLTQFAKLSPAGQATLP